MSQVPLIVKVDDSYKKINLMQINLASILTKTLTAQNEKQFKFF